MGSRSVLYSMMSSQAVRESVPLPTNFTSVSYYFASRVIWSWVFSVPQASQALTTPQPAGLRLTTFS